MPLCPQWEMGAGARHSALDSHWGGWNWRKITGFGKKYFNRPPLHCEYLLAGTLLLKNLHEARQMVRKCRKICTDFECQTDPATIKEWHAMKHSWERDPSNPDPYRLTEKRRSSAAFSTDAVK